VANFTLALDDTCSVPSITFVYEEANDTFITTRRCASGCWSSPHKLPPHRGHPLEVNGALFGKTSRESSPQLQEI